MDQALKKACDEQLEARLDSYVDIVRPGAKDSPIPPLTFMQYLPAVVISILLTIMLFVVGVMYY